jgi:hypothetical protein
VSERNRLANKTFVGVFLSLISWTSKKLDENVFGKLDPRFREDDTPS